MVAYLRGEISRFPRGARFLLLFLRILSAGAAVIYGLSKLGVSDWLATAVWLLFMLLALGLFVKAALEASDAQPENLKATAPTRGRYESHNSI